METKEKPKPEASERRERKGKILGGGERVISLLSGCELAIGPEWENERVCGAMQRLYDLHGLEIEKDLAEMRNVVATHRGTHFYDYFSWFFSSSFFFSCFLLFFSFFDSFFLLLSD
jgi:hypothetical protein